MKELKQNPFKNLSKTVFSHLSKEDEGDLGETDKQNEEQIPNIPTVQELSNLKNNVSGETPMVTNHTASERAAKSPRLNIAQKNEILSHFQNNGLNSKEISDVTGIRYNQVCHYISKVTKRRGGAAAEFKRIEKEVKKEEGSSRPHSGAGSWNRTPPSDDKIIMMREMFEKGHTFSEISRATGVSINTATRYAKGGYREHAVKKLGTIGTGSRTEVAETRTSNPLASNSPLLVQQLKDQIDTLMAENRRLQKYKEYEQENVKLKAQVQLLKDMLKE